MSHVEVGPLQTAPGEPARTRRGRHAIRSVPVPDLPPPPPPVLVETLRQPGPIVPRHGALGRLMNRRERRYLRSHPDET